MAGARGGAAYGAENAERPAPEEEGEGEEEGGGLGLTAHCSSHAVDIT